MNRIRLHRLNFTMIAVLVGLTASLTACNFNPEVATPTAEGIDVPVNPQPEVTLSLTALTPTVTLTPTFPPTVEVAMLESPLPTGTPPPASPTPSPTATLGPYEHVIQSGDTLFAIIQQVGYFDFQVVPDIERLNPSIPDLNNLPVGRTLLIPRQTHTPTPVGMEMTAVIQATLGITPVKAVPDNAPIECYTVVEGDDLVSIAENFNTTLEVLKGLNPDLYFPPTCDFNIRSGGPECNVLINIGQCIRVPYPTPTATLSPTPSGSETATPTPTYPAPPVISPPSGAIISGGILLEWSSAGALKPGEVYFVQIYDPAQPDAPPVGGVSRTNAFRLPPELVPTDGQNRLYEWTVAVARLNAAGSAYQIIGATSPRHQFTLLSR